MPNKYYKKLREPFDWKPTLELPSLEEIYGVNEFDPAWLAAAAELERLAFPEKKAKK